MEQRTLPVAELYGPVIQGEGYVQGMRSMFLRLALCDGSDGGGKTSWCVWCDSMNAVDPINRSSWTRLTASGIVALLESKAPYCKVVTITGGNPAIHDLDELVQLLKAKRYTILVETQGTYSRPWLWYVDVVTVSPKPPSAGRHLPLEALGSFLKRVGTRDEQYVVIKVVVDVDSPHDYDYACAIARRHAHDYEVYFLCRTYADDTQDQLLNRYTRLESIVAQDTSIPDVRTSVQMHVVLHGHKTGI